MSLRALSFLRIALAGTFLLLLLSCEAELNVQAYGEDGAKIAFKMNVSQRMLNIARELSGSDDFEIFSESEIERAFKSAKTAGKEDGSIEAFSVSVKDGGVEASASVKTLASFDSIIKVERTANSLTLKMRPSEAKNIYTAENSDYLDLLMIPTITNEVLSADEYNSLLSAIYGPSFASEITDGAIKINLLSPDGKSLSVSLTSGDVLTCLEEKTWTLTW